MRLEQILNGIVIAIAVAVLILLLDLIFGLFVGLAKATFPLLIILFLIGLLLRLVGTWRSR